MKKILTYNELISLPTFEERFEYLKLSGPIGIRTFGSDRWLNQAFYNSYEWREFRKHIIVRDYGCDLGIDDGEHDIVGDIIVIHHLNPLTVEQLKEDFQIALDPNNVIACSSRTHKALHYANLESLPKPYIPRTKNDTCPWLEG